MHRIDNATAVDVIPTPQAVGPNPDGYFTRGDSESGEPATIVSADWANAVQEELCKVIEDAGLTLDKTSRSQLKTAIATMATNATKNNYAVATGTNTYAATISNTISAYSAGLTVLIKFTNANSGASTLNVNSVGAVAIKTQDGNDVITGNILAGYTYVLVHNGTYWILLNNKFAIKGADIASATTTNIGASEGDFVDVTGTTTITSFGTVSAGTVKTVRFTGALTLTHNATSLILPGAVNITTASGDVGVFRSLGSGNWVCVSYVRASSGANTVIGVKGADIASATTTNLATATGDFVDVTGTTTITGLGTITAGIERTVRFTGALTLTHNATSLILPGSTNITTANGDVAVFRSLGSGNWKCVSYTKQDGTAVVVNSTSAPFIDSTAIIKGSADATKLVRIEADGLTTGTTRVWTALDRDTNIGNNWEFIASATASASATIDFSSIDASSYASHMVIFCDVIPATNAVQLYLRLSTGASYKSGASDYSWVMWAFVAAGGGASASSGAAQIPMSDTTNTLGTGARQTISGRIILHNAAGTSEHKRVTYQNQWLSSGGSEVSNVGGGRLIFTTAVDGIRFLMSSGNIASGKFYLYGQRVAA